MNWETILTSVAMPIILALLTSICVATINIKAAAKADKEKREFERNDFVIKKLYALLERLESLHGFINTTNDFEKSFQDALDRRSVFVEIYKTARPIIAKRYCVNIDEFMKQEEIAYCKLHGFLNTDDFKRVNERNDAIMAWVPFANKISDTLSTAIQNQITYYFHYQRERENA
ncbi:MAG: hypothetical protein LBN38_04335 [Verrucomicrobiota bacterium]|jgi:hypothetical protein|nr:hypothetical protein [Verrucomicrobiota bacterium]